MYGNARPVKRDAGNLRIPGITLVTAPGGDANPIGTVVLDEGELRKNLLPGGQSFDWPPLEDKAPEGVVWTEEVLDRTGKIRAMNPPVADNPGGRNRAEQDFRAMQFRPFRRKAIPVPAMGRLTVFFKTVRPAGKEPLIVPGHSSHADGKSACLLPVRPPLTCSTPSSRSVHLPEFRPEGLKIIKRPKQRAAILGDGLWQGKRNRSKS